MKNVKLNLKDAYRYSSHLSELMVALLEALYLREELEDLIYDKSEKHFKSKANAEAQDEEKIITRPNKYGLKNIDDLFTLYGLLRDEKIKIMKEIDKAKQNLLVEVDGEYLSIDTAIKHNMMTRQHIAVLIDHVLSVEDDVIDRKGQDYMFNEEKNQVPYYYLIEETIETKYNIANIERLKADALSKADNISKQVDELNNKRVIEFEPKYSVYDTLLTVVSKLYD